MSTKEEVKKAWKAYRFKKAFPFKISTIKLSHKFNCSETLICHLMRINEERDKLPSNKIIRRKRIIEKPKPFDYDIPF